MKVIMKRKRGILSLDRFLSAQERYYQTALKEIRQGRKETHWIWYVFPQIQGLGHSLTAREFGIKDLQEAQDFVAHPILGSRLIEICQALLSLKTDRVQDIFDFPDDIKLKSSMTLFSLAAPDIEVFQAVLDKFFNGKKDYNTLKILQCI